MSEIHTIGAWAAVAVPLVLTLVAGLAASADAMTGAVLAGRRARGELSSPLRSTARLLLTQRRTTTVPDSLLWRVGGCGVLVVACVATVVVPLGAWSAADLSVGVVWWSALIAVLWVLLHMLGYSANAGFPLVGGYRFLAQAMAYEMPMAISIICAALAAHSLQVGEVVSAQHGLWYAVWMPAAFVIFLICGLAASFYGPFSTPTASALGGGLLAELSGIDRLVVLAGRYLVLTSVAGFGTAMFLGGGAGPVLPAAVWTLLKSAGVLAVLIAARWRWPQIRTERFEEIGWVVLLPLSVLQALIVSLVVL
jgi:NADH-quinone oxidoreductase subunit H